jgi:hypothetical protein
MRSHPTPTRSRERLGQGVFARRPATEVPHCGERVGMAVGLSGVKGQHGPAVRGAASASHRRIGPAARHQRGCEKGGPRQARELPHATARIRHTPAGRRLRHPDDSGTAWASGRQHDDDLYPCPQPGRQRGLQSHRSLLITVRSVAVLGCKVLGCRILQPNTGTTVLAGEAQPC